VWRWMLDRNVWFNIMEIAVSSGRCIGLVAGICVGMCKGEVMSSVGRWGLNEVVVYMEFDVVASKVELVSSSCSNIGLLACICGGMCKNEVMYVGRWGLEKVAVGMEFAVVVRIALGCWLVFVPSSCSNIWLLACICGGMCKNEVMYVGRWGLNEVVVDMEFAVMVVVALGCWLVSVGECARRRQCLWGDGA